MSFASLRLPAFHLLISLPLLKICDSSLPSLEMRDLLFVDRMSHSEFDLVQEFFNRTLLPSCDLTANLCDINCCNDEDCTEDNLQAFSCTKQPESFSVDPVLSDRMRCHSEGTTFSDPVLCYDTENSPFLGVYFMEDRILKRKLVEMKLENSPPNRYFSASKSGQPLGDQYKHGVPLRFAGKDDFVTLPSEILGKGYCDYYSPIRFLEDTDSLCTSEISPELCESNPRFHLETYIQEQHGELRPPAVFSGADGPLVTNITVQCGRDIFDIDDFHVVNDILEACGNASKIGRTSFDDVRRVCEHVVTLVEYHFTWDANALVALDMAVGLSEISTEPTESRVPSKTGRNPRFGQKFKTGFHRRETNSGKRQRDSYNLNDEILLHHVS